MDIFRLLGRVERFELLVFRIHTDIEPSAPNFTGPISESLPQNNIRNLGVGFVGYAHQRTRRPFSRKKEKQNRAADANMAEWKHIQGLLDKIRGTGTGGINSDDHDALPKLREKLAHCEREQEKMKVVNAFYRKHGTLDGCPLLSAEEIEKMKTNMARSWRAAPKPYESGHLSSNNQTIRNIKVRIAELEAKQSSPAPEGWSFDGGSTLTSHSDRKPAERLRPESEEISHIAQFSAKRETERYEEFLSRQRILNQNGIRAAKEVTERWITPAEHAECTTEQTLNEELCSEEPAPFSYPQQSM